MDPEKGAIPAIAWLDEQQRIGARLFNVVNDISARRASQDSLVIERVEAAEAPSPGKKLRRRPSNDPALILPSTFRTL